MNQFTMKMFNIAYYRKHPSGKQHGMSHYEPFFFRWISLRTGIESMESEACSSISSSFPRPRLLAVREVLRTVTDNGMASFLSVIKELRDVVHPGLSFPRPGITLALDFPNHGKPLLEMLDRLDAIVASAGGRVYLGKDAVLARTRFERCTLNGKTGRPSATNGTPITHSNPSLATPRSRRT